MYEPTKTTLSSPVGERDHAEGEAGATVTIVEYGDYECPHCRTADRVVERLREKVGGDRLRFVFRHFPLTQIHRHAFRAAEAAEAAGEQGSFWRMHRLLFERNGALTDGGLVEAAAALRLDVPQFLRALSTRRHSGRVREDLTSGTASGASGTPTFFINGRLHDAAWDFDALHKAVRRAAD